jgi:hypothetical protein
MSKPTILYYIGPAPDGPVKIGITTNIAVRFKSIQIHSPIPVAVFGIADGSLQMEAAIHHRFRRLRKHYEWFDLDDELRRFIAENTHPWVVPPERAKRPRVARDRISSVATVGCTPRYKEWACNLADRLNLSLFGAIDGGLRLMAADDGYLPPPEAREAKIARGRTQNHACESNCFTVLTPTEWRGWLNGFVAFRKECTADTIRIALARSAATEGFGFPPNG